MRFNLYHKLTIALALITAVIFTGVFLYLKKTLTVYYFSSIESNLKKEVDISKFMVETALKGRAGFDADDIADNLGRNLHERVTVIGPDGVVLGDSNLEKGALETLENHLYRPEVQAAIKTGYGSSERFSTTLKKKMLYVAALARGNGKNLIVRVAVPLSEIEALQGQLAKFLVALLLTAFVMTIIITFLASGLISIPIKNIVSVAGKMASGDFSARSDYIGNDEIGDLSNAINDLREQIMTRMDDIITEKSRLEAVLMSMVEGVMVTDNRGTVILMNKALLDALHISHIPEEKRPIEVIRNVAIKDIVDVALHRGAGLESREISVHIPEERILLVHAAPVSRSGEVDGAVVVFHDITELRKLEKVRRDFVANVTHELRTPVSNIKGYTETLLDGAMDDKANAADFLKIVQSNSERLIKLIDELLDLSGIESGKMKLSVKPARLPGVVRQVLSDMSKAARENNVKIVNDISDAIPDVMADTGRIAQVISNLVDNAIKYNKDNGEVRVSARTDKGFLVVEIADTGIGIPEDDKARIFERFYRVDKARSQEMGGTGLGLSIVKHIIQAHGGDVIVESVLGEGSKFSFTLPLAV